MSLDSSLINARPSKASDIRFDEGVVSIAVGHFRPTVNKGQPQWRPVQSNGLMQKRASAFSRSPTEALTSSSITLLFRRTDTVRLTRAKRCSLRQPKDQKACRPPTCAPPDTDWQLPPFLVCSPAWHPLSRCLRGRIPRARLCDTAHHTCPAVGSSADGTVPTLPKKCSRSSRLRTFMASDIGDLVPGDVRPRCSLISSSLAVVPGRITMMVCACSPHRSWGCCDRHL